MNAEFQRLIKDIFASPAKTTECFNGFRKILSEEIDKDFRSKRTIKRTDKKNSMAAKLSAFIIIVCLLKALLFITISLRGKNEVFSNKSYTSAISRIEIAHTEDPNTILQAQALREECSLEKDCPTKQ